jgi:hypothetical protein
VDARHTWTHARYIPSFPDSITEFHERLIAVDAEETLEEKE